MPALRDGGELSLGASRPPWYVGRLELSYMGEGESHWPSVDTRDAARLYRLALESAPAGTRWPAFAEEGIVLRDIAAVIGSAASACAPSVSPPRRRNSTSAT